MELETLRREIDALDREILSLFQQRMQLCRAIGAYKKTHGLPIFQPQREAEKLRALTENLPQADAEDVQALFREIISLSRARQEAL